MRHARSANRQLNVAITCMESISLRKTIGIQCMIFMRILEPPFKNEQKSHSDVYNVKICIYEEYQNDTLFPQLKDSEITNH